MPPDTDAPLPYHCPACRRFDHEAGRMHVAELADTAATGVLVCRGCGVGHPLLEGGTIPVILKDASGVLALPGGDRDGEWPPPVEAWCRELAEVDPAMDAFREAWLLSAFLVADYPQSAPNRFVADAMHDQHRAAACFREWLETHAGAGARTRRAPALEIGCGACGMAPLWLAATDANVHLIDLRPGTLRAGLKVLRGERVALPWRRVGRRFEPIVITGEPVDTGRLRPALADALDPPWPAERFGLIAAISVVDIVRDPWMLLGQMDALLAPGGLLLLAQPFQYEPHVQNPQGWFNGPDGLRHALRGGLVGLEHLDYEILEEAPALPWNLPAHDRLVHRYALDAVLARKRAT